MHGSRSRVEILSLALSLLALAPIARAMAQQSVRRSWPPLELRVDAIDVKSVTSGTLHGGGGVNVPLGYYVRFEIDGSVGVTTRDSVEGTSGRIDALARFLFDPFNE